MIAKIVQGANFRGAVSYVLGKRDAEFLAAKGLRMKSIDSIAESFGMQASLCPIAKPVAHISLDFSVQDRTKLTDAKMTDIASEYLRRMGYDNTQVLVVRHNDREHPHLHMIINRVDFDGNRISDCNERLRSTAVCRELTERYGLYFSSGKEHVNEHRLREPDKTKYEIYNAVRSALPNCSNWEQLVAALDRRGVAVLFKYKGTTDRIDGVKFSKNGYTFSGSKVDCAFGFSKLDAALNRNDERERPQFVSPHSPLVEGSASVIGSLLNAADMPNDDSEEEMFRRRMQQLHRKKRGRRM